jgi:N-methylhydantoinase A/oxoprolinase/acetone carboxylase beta subunit
VNKALAGLQERAEAQMEKDGIAKARRKFSFSLDMRHRGQINEVEVMLPEGRLKGDFAERLRNRFYARYEQLYGKGSSYRGARLEIVTLRVRATAATPRPKLSKARTRSATIPKEAKRGPRAIYWAEAKRTLNTPVLDGALLKPGNRIKGPCVVETTQTNVVVHPGRTLRVDEFGNFEILFK